MIKDIYQFVLNVQNKSIINYTTKYKSNIDYYVYMLLHICPLFNLHLLSYSLSYHRKINQWESDDLPCHQTHMWLATRRFASVAEIFFSIHLLRQTVICLTFSKCKCPIEINYENWRGYYGFSVTPLLHAHYINYQGLWVTIHLLITRKPNRSLVLPLRKIGRTLKRTSSSWARKLWSPIQVNSVIVLMLFCFIRFSLQ